MGAVKSALAHVFDISPRGVAVFMVGIDDSCHLLYRNTACSDVLDVEHAHPCVTVGNFFEKPPEAELFRSGFVVGDHHFTVVDYSIGKVVAVSAGRKYGMLCYRCPWNMLVFLVCNCPSMHEWAKAVGDIEALMSQLQPATLRH